MLENEDDELDDDNDPEGLLASLLGLLVGRLVGWNVDVHMFVFGSPVVDEQVRLRKRSRLDACLDSKRSKLGTHG